MIQNQPLQKDRPETRPAPDRLSAAARRESILDTAFELLRERGPEGVTMGSVAERAAVTRTLIYKHFSNRGDLLSAVFRRESERVHRALAAEVRAVEGFDARLRALVRAIFRAVDSHGWWFVPLQAAYSLEPEFRAEQGERDRQTVAAFAELASQELNIAPADASAALAVLLSGIGPLRVQARTKVSAEERAELEDLYMNLVLGGLHRIARAPES